MRTRGNDKMKAALSSILIGCLALCPVVAITLLTAKPTKPVKEVEVEVAPTVSINCTVNRVTYDTLIDCYKIRCHKGTCVIFATMDDQDPNIFSKGMKVLITGKLTNISDVLTDTLILHIESDTVILNEK